jgi:NADH:ubiquinone oxidoreductase subunit F (NADH-binding)
LKKALALSPAEALDQVKHAIVRGRGGAGFPAGMKWGLLVSRPGLPVYLICNADEGEPGTFKDRQIMEHDPHLLIEGMAIAAHAIQAKQAFIYIRGEYAWIARILEGALAEAKAAGWLGQVEILVHRGAGSYVCGDETALIESLEGKRGNPRRKPPFFPASIGLYGAPTIVNNVETLACLPYVFTHGPDAFKKLGVVGNAGPKLFGVSGHVHRPGIYEFELGVPLATLLEAAGGVVGRMKGVIVGGLSVPILTAEEAADLKLDYDSCLKKRTMLGSGGVIVINETVSIPELALRAIRFYAHESCGQCAPCREGSATVAHLLERLVRGQGSAADIERALHICKRVQGLTLCPTGDAFGMPLEAMISKFRGEFEALVN